jgi:hypothetical protein
MEEFFLHLWDDLDDLAGICRYAVAATAAEVLAAAPQVTAAAGALLAGGAALLLVRQALLNAFA